MANLLEFKTTLPPPDPNSRPIPEKQEFVTSDTGSGVSP